MKQKICIMTVLFAMLLAAAAQAKEITSIKKEYRMGEHPTGRDSRRKKPVKIIRKIDHPKHSKIKSSKKIRVKF